jgi:hypothetical protein
MHGDGTPTADVDIRVAQLQHALTSRIVVEQAKGMLAERYSLSPDEAFELIRVAARSNRLKVHAISKTIVADPRETPVVILELLSDLPGHSLAPGRAVENVFRQINDNLLKIAEGGHFICECSDASCTDSIEVSAATMRRLHEDRNLYVIKPEHINADLEEVVEDCDGFVVVRKTASA